MIVPPKQKICSFIILAACLLIIFCGCTKSSGGTTRIRLSINPTCGGSDNFIGDHLFADKQTSGAFNNYLFAGGYTYGDTKEMAITMIWPPAAGTYNMGGLQDVGLYYDPVNNASDPNNPDDYYSPTGSGTITINSVSLNSLGSAVDNIDITINDVIVMNSAGDVLCISGTIKY